MTKKKKKPEDHMEPGEEKWAFKRIRLDVYVKNCNSGYLPTAKPVKGSLVGYENAALHEVHHVLNVHSCDNANIPKNLLKFVFDCFKITKWDINEWYNVIGLPKKWAYVADNAITDLTSAFAGWHNLPCHQVDHDLYWRKVDSWVQDEIFKKLQEIVKNEDCDEAKGEKIAKQFDDGSDLWRGFLNNRGSGGESDGLGAGAALKYCRSEKATKAKDRIWFIPLSMSPNPDEARRRTKPSRDDTPLLRARLLAAIGEKVK